MDATGPAPSGRSYAGVIALIAIGQVIFGTDFGAVNVSLASIGRAMNIAPSLMPWVIATYSLTYAGLLVLGGRAADLYGRRFFCLAGLAVFGAGTITAALSGNLATLIAGRALEGIGSAFLIPASFSLINVLLPAGPVRHAAFSVFSATQGVAMIFGLCLGGVLTTTFGWPAAFLINVPLVIAALILAFRYIPPLAPSTARKSLDIGGAVLITAGVALVLFALSEMGEHGWTSRQALWPLGVAAIVFAAFFLLESRLSQPLVPLRLFRIPNLMGANLGSVGAMAATGGAFVLLNLFMQKVLHFSAMMSGVGMLPYALAVMLAGRLVGFCMARFPIRRSILLGFLVFVLGTSIFAAVSSIPNYAMGLAPGMIVVGLGSTIATILLMALSTSEVPHETQGVATGVLVTFQQIGLALGVSVALTVIGASTRSGDSMLVAFRHGFLATSAMASLGFVAVLLLTRKPSHAVLPEGMAEADAH